MAVTDRRGVIVAATDPANVTDPNPGLAYKVAVKCATAGVAVTFSGLSAVDGVTLNEGDRVLVKDQADQTTNGIWNASAGSWSRATDADTGSDFATGVQVYVLNGLVNQGQTYVCTTANPVILGASAIVWQQLPRPQATIEFVIDGNGGTIVTGDRVALEVPFACTVARYTILSPVVTSIVVDVRWSTYANYPGVVSIAGSDIPTLSNAQKSQSTALTGWAPKLNAGDILVAHVSSVSSASLVTLSLLVNRN